MKIEKDKICLDDNETVFSSEITELDARKIKAIIKGEPMGIFAARDIKEQATRFTSEVLLYLIETEGEEAFDTVGAQRSASLYKKILLQRMTEFKEFIKIICERVEKLEEPAVKSKKGSGK